MQLNLSPEPQVFQKENTSPQEREIRNSYSIIPQFCAKRKGKLNKVLNFNSISSLFLSKTKRETKSSLQVEWKEPPLMRKYFSFKAS